MWKAEAGVGGHWPPFPLGDNIPTTPLASRIPAGGGAGAGERGAKRKRRSGKGKTGGNIRGRRVWGEERGGGGGVGRVGGEGGGGGGGARNSAAAGVSALGASGQL